MIVYNKVFFRNKIVDFKDANLSVASSPVLYGLSTYSVLPIFLTKDKKFLNLFRIEDHVQRLFNSSRILGFTNFQETWDSHTLKNIIIETIHENKIRSDSLLRMSVFIDENLSGATSFGLKCSVVIFIYPLNSLDRNNFKVLISSWRRNPDNSIPSRAKANGSYVNSALMKNEAISLGFDDAISLDDSGHITESTVSNVFIVRNNTLISPENSSDLLEGITRDTILNIAKELKIKTELRPIDRTEIYLADEVFLCGSSYNIVPVSVIDDKIINQSKIGVITQKIGRYYLQLTKNTIEDKFKFNYLLKL